jgi:hypothetical protein
VISESIQNINSGKINVLQIFCDTALESEMFKFHKLSQGILQVEIAFNLEEFLHLDETQQTKKYFQYALHSIREVSRKYKLDEEKFATAFENISKVHI